MVRKRRVGGIYIVVGLLVIHGSVHSPAPGTARAHLDTLSALLDTYSF